MHYVDFSAEDEITLFRAICRFRPIGLHKHVRMGAILRALNYEAIGSSIDGIRDVKLTAQQVWTKLEEMYNISGIEELEQEDPVGDGDDDDKKELDFNLPWDEFGLLMEQHALDPGSKRRGSGAASTVPLTPTHTEAEEHKSDSDDESLKGTIEITSADERASSEEKIIDSKDTEEFPPPSAPLSAVPPKRRKGRPSLAELQQRQLYYEQQKQQRQIDPQGKRDRMRSSSSAANEQQREKRQRAHSVASNSAASDEVPPIKKPRGRPPSATIAAVTGTSKTGSNVTARGKPGPKPGRKRSRKAK